MKFITIVKKKKYPLSEEISVIDSIICEFYCSIKKIISSVTRNISDR